MTEQEKNTMVAENTEAKPEVTTAPEAQTQDSTAPRAPQGGRSGGPGGRGAGGPGGPGGRRGRPRGRPSRQSQRPRSEFDQKIINIRRVTRVVAGGRRFSFSVAIIIGNKKGKVGVGLGKAGDTTLAIDKAVRDAKKHLITINLTKDNSIAHEVAAKYTASLVTLTPVKGRGLVAGSSVRSVLELGGVNNIVAKLHSGSKNGLNNARAAIAALKELKA